MQRPLVRDYPLRPGPCKASAIKPRKQNTKIACKVLLLSLERCAHTHVQQGPRYITPSAPFPAGKTYPTCTLQAIPNQYVPWHALPQWHALVTPWLDQAPTFPPWYASQLLAGEGLITYMRTDGLQMASEAVSAIRSTVQRTFGDEFVPQSPHVYKSRSKNAQVWVCGCCGVCEGGCVRLHRSRRVCTP